jgi:hypothetical protein
MGEMRNVYRILFRKTEGKGPLRRPRHGWEGNVRMEGWESVDWMHLGQDRG